MNEIAWAITKPPYVTEKQSAAWTLRVGVGAG